MIPFGPKPIPESRWFESKPLPARLFIMLAGVTMNALLAYVIYVGLSAALGIADAGSSGGRRHSRISLRLLPESRQGTASPRSMAGRSRGGRRSSTASARRRGVPSCWESCGTGSRST